MKHALAGFTDSTSGLWTFLDIEIGDHVSFLYGARAFNLYEVTRKVAYDEAASLPPWPPVKFRRLYHFPFRLELKQLRELKEPLVRTEFAYVAENLLLRGGYRKTHFQADQTTLQNVSQMGAAFGLQPEPLNLPRFSTFTPEIVRAGSEAQPPYSFALNEFLVQAAVRRHLSNMDNLEEFLQIAEIQGVQVSGLEVLGEKAFPEGHVDLLIKHRVPIGRTNVTL